MKAALLVISIALVVFGCGRSDLDAPKALSSNPGEMPAPGPQHHQRFVGLWLVDQPYHAGYEATYYSLAADGTVSVADSYTIGGIGPPSPYSTGVVAPSWGDPLRCEFGAAWHSISESRLMIETTCTDGVARTAELSFLSEAARNGMDLGAKVSLVSVGGQSGWIHPDAQWRFKKCPPDVGTPRSCH